MSAEPPDGTIADYIRANRGIYTREAIRQRLLDAGHGPEAIDAAWEALEAEEARNAPPQGAAIVPPATRRVVATAQFWLLLMLSACLALAALPIISIVVLSGIASLGSNLAGSRLDSGPAVIATVIAVLLLGYLLIAAGGWALLRRDRAAGYGVFTGLAIAFVLSVILGGTCVAILQTL